MPGGKRGEQPREVTPLESAMNFIIVDAPKVGRVAEAQLTLLYGRHVTAEQARSAVMAKLDEMIHTVEDYKKQEE